MNAAEREAELNRIDFDAELAVGVALEEMEAEGIKHESKLYPEWVILEF